MRPNDAGASPVLSDVTIRTAERRALLGCGGSSTSPPPSQPLPPPTQPPAPTPPPVPPDRECPDFPDLPLDNVHFDDICDLVLGGTLLGYRDGRFAPATAMTRGQTASVLARASGLEGFTMRPPTFTDIAGDTHEASIEALATEDIARGFADGTYRPSHPIPRDQAASLLARWLGLTPVATGPFTDVPATNVHLGNINALFDAGIVRGTSATTFDPSANIRRDQFAAWVHRALE
jgi:hypothetical protein